MIKRNSYNKFIWIASFLFFSLLELLLTIGIYRYFGLEKLITLYTATSFIAAFVGYFFYVEYQKHKKQRNQSKRLRKHFIEQTLNESDKRAMKSFIFT